jgi:hypothetical protein
VRQKDFSIQVQVLERPEAESPGWRSKGAGNLNLKHSGPHLENSIRVGTLRNHTPLRITSRGLPGVTVGSPGHPGLAQPNCEESSSQLLNSCKGSSVPILANHFESPRYELERPLHVFNHQHRLVLEFCSGLAARMTQITARLY